MPKARLEAFSDAIIAFAITLLILQIQIPQLGQTSGNSAMVHALLSLAPNFAVYTISFLICSVWWISHHAFIHDLRNVNRPLLWLNGLFLMWIAFLPFPTALLGRYPTQPVAAALYGAVCTLTATSFWIMRWYASLRGRLMKDEISVPELHRRLRVSLRSPVLYFAGTVVALFFPPGAMLLYAAIPAYFAVAKLGGSVGQP